MRMKLVEKIREEEWRKLGDGIVRVCWTGFFQLLRFFVLALMFEHSRNFTPLRQKLVLEVVEVISLVTQTGVHLILYGIISNAVRNSWIYKNHIAMTVFRLYYAFKTDMTWIIVKSRYEGDLVAKGYFTKHKLVWKVLEQSLQTLPDIMALKANCSEDGAKHGLSVCHLKFLWSNQSIYSHLDMLLYLVVYFNTLDLGRNQFVSFSTNLH